MPVDLETIVLKCLRKRPSDRYGTAEALGQDLRRFVRGDAVEARQEALWEKGGRWIHRQASKIAAAGVLSVLVVVSSWLAWLIYKDNLPRYDEVVPRQIQRILGQRIAGSSPLGEDEGALVPPLLSETYGLENAVTRLGEISEIYPDRPEAPFWQACGLLLLEQGESARDALDRALAANPNFAPAKVLRARLDEGDAALDLSLEDSASWAQVWLEADRARSDRDWSGAVKALEELIDLRKRGVELPFGIPAEIYLDRGLALTELGRHEDAIASFEAAAAIFPGFLEPDLLRAKVHWLRGDRNRAEELLEKTYDRGGKGDVVIRAILVVLESLGEYRAALPWAGKLDQDVARERLLSFFYLYSEQYDKAIHAARRAVAFDREDPGARFRIVRALRDKIRRISSSKTYSTPERDALSTEVREHLRKLLELVEKPGGEAFRALAWNCHALELFRDGRFKDALEACDQAIAVDRTETWPKGWLLTRLGRFEEAVELALTDIEARPRSHYAIGVLGRIYGRLGLNDDSVRMLERYRDLRHEPPEVYDHLIPALIKVDRHPEAIRELCKVVERWPHRSGVFQTLLFRTFWQVPELVESPEAVDLLEKLDAARPPEGLTLLAFLRLHLAAGRELTSDGIAPARREASEAVEHTDRANAEALAVLAECEYASGESARAVRTLREALALPGATRRHAMLLGKFSDELPSEPLETVPGDSDPTVEALPDSWWKTGVLRINCGGKACTDESGRRWEADLFFLGGRPSRRWPSLPRVDPVYHRNRSFPEETYRPAYRIPVPPETYRVTLDFVELYFGAPGLRSFDVILEGELLEIGDLFARVGFGEVDSWSRTLRVEDGVLDIRFVSKKESPTIAAITIEPDR